MEPERALTVIEKPKNKFVPKFQFKSKFLILAALILLILAASGAGGFYFLKTKGQDQIQGTSNINTLEVSEEEGKDLLEKVGKLMVLPTDEQPTIGTITDIEKLKAEPFFAKATNGDKVLIYEKAKKIILYNPAENRIVDVQPISINESTPEAQLASPSPSPSPSPTPLRRISPKPSPKASPSPSPSPQQ